MSDALICISSFGFKFGVPDDADFVFDVRCLPNPYWVDDMRELTGLDDRVLDYVFSAEQAHGMLRAAADVVATYADNTTKPSFNVYVGCTGGRHRSVSFARALSDALAERGYQVRTSHRERDRFDLPEN